MSRGVPIGITTGTSGATLGHTVCTDIGNRSAADAKVLRVANLQLSTTWISPPSPRAEMIVFWAINDLCPQFSNQIQEHWRDGAQAA
jgi:hypothetical protein